MIPFRQNWEDYESLGGEVTPAMAEYKQCRREEQSDDAKEEQYAQYIDSFNAKALGN